MNNENGPRNRFEWFGRLYGFQSKRLRAFGFVRFSFGA